jgi:cytochrome c oxidase subunit 2
MIGVDFGFAPTSEAHSAVAAAAALPLHPDIQSALAPSGAPAQAIATMIGVLGTGAAAIFLLVVAFVAYALLAAPRRRAWLARTGFVVAAGAVLPGTVLAVLLVYTLVAARPMVLAGSPPALRIEVVGEQWWWRVRYLGPDGMPLAATANELHIPVGRPVELALASADVIHSFWVPNLAGKLDMIPGRVNRLRVMAHKPGVSRGQCAEFCGGPHGQMALYVVAHAPAAFDRWLAAEREPAVAPLEPQRQAGAQLFLAHGCGVCHAVRGTEARGTRGPDLTHVAGRLSIGAGALPVNAAALASWIASSQHLKPGNLMPSFGMLPAAELQALAAYLDGLQ